MTHTEIWNLAIIWVKSHRVLIRCVAARYSPYMGCSAQDLESEALLVAYLTLRDLVRNNKDLSLMNRYFRVIFRSRCIHMAMGVDMVHELDTERMKAEQREERTFDPKLDQQLIEASLLCLTERQRLVAQWILSQDIPVNVSLIGQRFGITARGVRKLINNAIFRIENGHHRVCKTVTALT
ncbi:sigma-70 family RNA polymerase sigma factor [Desulfogranum marinum]|uniref:sigma-70 family RNA polymerase sigma factor n=1 Tax=Desulfogranum marinum TaxID=453220 RepID=UPI001966B7E0|nr:sigma-70 family RNA polymerase sigma factor [Desulfogranum marinum]MBM9514057.1 sigma-70 family RNA polymerase sigma factor [Desulfogranum marinum]